MVKRLLVALCLAAILGGGAAVALDGPAQARDTNWPCPAC